MLHRKTAQSILLGWALVLIVSQPGCVRRRLMVRSNPPGAMVYVDNQPIGTTPCATNFVYYGTREVRLVKAGYETLTVNQPIPAPWYQIPPLDFISENLVPRKIKDYRTISFNMQPQVIVPAAQLLARAEQLRQSTGHGVVLPQAATSLPGVLTPGLPGGNSPILPQPPLGSPTFTPPQGVVPHAPIPGTQNLSSGALPLGGQPLGALPPPQR
ncbi:MAG: PEGA domain-containing protein [Pirellulales bacterium]|nr:PEGA domain-containing protein [Pirellulales bacterium]